MEKKVISLEFEVDATRMTSIRKSGNSAVTTIPVEVMRMLDLSIGDKLEYKIDLDNRTVLIDKLKKE